MPLLPSCQHEKRRFTLPARVADDGLSRILRDPCPAANNRKDAKNAEQVGKDLCARCVSAFTFTSCGESSYMRSFPGEGTAITPGFNAISG